MGQPDAERTVISSPEGLLGIVPALLQFQPAQSLVVIGVGDDRKVQVTLRYDLPGPGDEEISASIAQHAVAVLTANRIPVMAAVLYGPAALAGVLARDLTDAASDAGVRVGEFLRADNGRYWSYMCSDEECHPAAGLPYTADGGVTATRPDLAGTVAPPGGELLAAMKTEVAAAAASWMPCATAHAGLAASRKLIYAYENGEETMSDQDAAEALVALRDLRVRDDAWARMDPARRDVHVRLWTDLLRRAPHPYAPAPAALLAFTAWQCGNGALANIALDRALADDPGYSMALLLRQVITAGAPPSMASLPMTPEEVAASYDGQPLPEDLSAVSFDAGPDETVFGPAC